MAHGLGATRGWAVLFAMAMGGLLIMLAPAAEGRSRCKFGQIYRPSLGVCQAKSSQSAQPYVKRSTRKQTAAPKVVVRERVIVKEVVREQDPEPMSAIPLREPKAQGSLNPLPRWKPDL